MPDLYKNGCKTLKWYRGSQIGQSKFFCVRSGFLICCHVQNAEFTRFANKCILISGSAGSKMESRLDCKTSKTSFIWTGHDILVQRTFHPGNCLKSVGWVSNSLKIASEPWLLFSSKDPDAVLAVLRVFLYLNCRVIVCGRRIWFGFRLRSDFVRRRSSCP